MPFQGTYPSTETFVRTDGVRTGLAVWEEAEAAGIDILSTAHDTHDQDIGSAINTLNARIISLDTSMGDVIFSEATANTSHIYEFTMRSGWLNVFVVDNIAVSQGAPGDVVLQLLKKTAASAAETSYSWVWDGYQGEPTAAVLDAYSSAAVSIPLATGIAQDGKMGAFGTIAVHSPFDSTARTVIRGVVGFTRGTTPRSISTITMAAHSNNAAENHVARFTVTSDPTSGHILHYGKRLPRDGTNIAS